MGAFHVETYEQIEAAQLVAVAEPDEAIARARIAGAGRSTGRGLARR